MHIDKLQLQNFASRCAARSWAKFCDKFGGERTILQCPEITISNRLRTTAGNCYYYHNVVDLNAKLLLEFPRDFANQIIPHELAHRVAFVLYSERGHGEPWQYVMQQYGIKPDRCHNLIGKRENRRRSQEAPPCGG